MKPDTSAAEDKVDKPNSVPYRGRKNGGTISGNVAIAEATKIVANRKSLNRRLDYQLMISWRGDLYLPIDGRLTCSSWSLFDKEDSGDHTC